MFLTMMFLMFLVSFGYTAYSLLPNGSFETADINYQNPNTAVSKWHVNCVTGVNYTFCPIRYTDANVGSWGIRGGLYPVSGHYARIVAVDPLPTGTIRLKARKDDASPLCVMQISSYYVRQPNVFTATGGTFTSCNSNTGNLTTNWSTYTLNYCGDINAYLVLNLYLGSSCSSYGPRIDYVEFDATPTLTIEKVTPNTMISADSSFLTSVKVKDLTGAYITTADINLNINSVGWTHMDYNATADAYTYYNVFGLTEGDYNFSFEAAKTGYLGTQQDYNIKVKENISTCVSLLSANKENVDVSIEGYEVVLDPVDEVKDFIFSMTNNCGTTSISYSVHNSLRDERQYYFYELVDGQYVLDETITYGNTNNNPIQKTWDSTNDRYDYTFEVATGDATTHTYKLEYRLPVIHTNDIINDNDWSVFFQPTYNFVYGDSNFYEVADAYFVSGVNNIKNVLKNDLGDVVDVNGAYVLEFTASASAGVVVGVTSTAGTDTNIVLTTVPHTYKFEVEGRNITISSYATTAITIYISNITLSERTYFRKMFDLLKENFGPLNSWVNQDTNAFFDILEEGKKFRPRVYAYDSDNTLTKMVVRVYKDTFVTTGRIYEYVFNLETYTIESRLVIDELLSPVYDLSDNQYQYQTNVLVTVILGNDTRLYEMQSRWLKLFNYPYFTNDVIIQTKEYTRTINTVSTGRVDLYLTSPETLVKLRLRYCTKSYTVPCTDANAIYYHDYYPITDFNLSSEKVLFSYRNDATTVYPALKFANSGQYVVFAELYLNTRTQPIYSREVFEIEGKTLYGIVELNVPETNEVGGSCYDGSSSSADWTGAFTSSILCGISAGNTPFTPACKVSYKYIHMRNCMYSVPTEYNPNITVRVWANKERGWLEDYTRYLQVRFRLKNAAGIYVSNYYYPDTIYYDADSGANTFEFRTTIVDSNNNYFADGDYNMVMFIDDLSFVHLPKEYSIRLRYGAFTITLDNVVRNASFLKETTVFNSPLRYIEIVKDKDRRIDLIKFTLFNKNSNFDPQKTDRENQVNTYSVDVRELARIRASQEEMKAWLRSRLIDWGVDANQTTKTFKTVGAISGGLLGVVGGYLVGLTVCAQVAAAAGIVSAGPGAGIFVPCALISLGGAALGGGAGVYAGGAVGEVTGGILSEDALNHIIDANNMVGYELVVSNFGEYDYTNSKLDPRNSEWLTSQVTPRNFLFYSDSIHPGDATLYKLLIGIKGLDLQTQYSNLVFDAVDENGLRVDDTLKLKVDYLYDNYTEVQSTIIPLSYVKKIGENDLSGADIGSCFSKINMINLEKKYGSMWFVMAVGCWIEGLMGMAANALLIVLFLFIVGLITLYLVKKT